MKTLNDLKTFAASAVAPGTSTRAMREDAQKTFLSAVEQLSGSFLKADGVHIPSNVSSPSIAESVGGMLFTLAAVAVAYNLDLDQLVGTTLLDYQQRLAAIKARRDDFFLTQLGLN